MKESTRIYRTFLRQELKSLRKKSGLSQLALANAAGVSQTLISEVEAGRSALGVGSVQRIATVLGVPPEWLYPTAGNKAIGQARSGLPRIDRIDAKLQCIDAATLEQCIQTIFDANERHEWKMTPGQLAWAVITLFTAVSDRKKPQHLQACGTEHRGCAPTCPKAMSERGDEVPQ